MVSESTTLIVNGHVQTVDDRRTIHSSGYVAVRGSIISGVGPMEECPSPSRFDETIDAEGMLVLPGLVNAHQHHWYTLFKGISEGYQLEDWFGTVLLPLARGLTPDDLEVSAYLSAFEMLTTGTTCFLNHSVTPTDADAVTASIEPFAKMGIRQMFCKEVRIAENSTVDKELTQLRQTIGSWRGSYDGLVSIGMVIETGAHWLHTGIVSEELILQGSRFAAQEGLRISNHVTGGTIWRSITDRIRNEGRNDVEHLMGLGVLGPEWILAHCTWINDREILFCAETGAHIVVCPASAAFTGGGVAPIRGFLDAGVAVALGTDGPMVNDSVDMVEQMKHTALLQNARYLTPGAVQSDQLLEMATINGAEALGLADQIGSISVGKKADIAVFDMSPSHWGVPLRPQAALIYAGKGTDARHVMVDGALRVRDGQISLSPETSTVSLKTVRAEAMKRSLALLERAGLAHMVER